MHFEYQGHLTAKCFFNHSISNFKLLGKSLDASNANKSPFIINFIASYTSLIIITSRPGKIELSKSRVKQTYSEKLQTSTAL